MNLLLANTATIICVLIAGAIILKYGPEASGYGWFLFIAVLLGCIPKSDDD